LTFWQQYDKAVIMAVKSETEKKTGIDGKDAKGQFAKGNRLSGSRKGIPNKITATVKEIISSHFQNIRGGHPEKYLTWLSKKEPAAYCGLIKEACLPKRLEITGEDGGPINIASLDLAAKNMKPYGPID